MARVCTLGPPLSGLRHSHSSGTSGRLSNSDKFTEQVPSSESPTTPCMQLCTPSHASVRCISPIIMCRRHDQCLSSSLRLSVCPIPRATNAYDVHSHLGHNDKQHADMNAPEEEGKLLVPFWTLSTICARAHMFHKDKHTGLRPRAYPCGSSFASDAQPCRPAPARACKT